MFEEDLDYLEDINHLIGSKNEEIRILPNYNEGFSKDARRSRLNGLQKRALIEESWGTTASNFVEKGDISNTHYEKHNKSEIAMMIMPLKGLGY